MLAYFWATGVSLMFSFRSIAEWGKFTELDAQRNFGWHNVAPRKDHLFEASAQLKSSMEYKKNQALEF